MKHFLGIDVGASKTHALLADETGRCIGLGRAGGGNYQGVGYDGLTRVLLESFTEALAAAGIERASIAGAGFGVAGYDFPSDHEPHMQSIAHLGLTCPIAIENDGANGLYAGATRGIGVNVTAGSSNNCRGRGPDGRTARIVGNGAMFGEFGGGHEIVIRALQMVNYAWIKRGPQTALTGAMLAATGATGEMDLMEGLSNERYQLTAAFAKVVFQLAMEGDAVAQDVLRWAGEELGWLAVAGIRQLGMENEDVEVVQSGSVFEGGEIIAEPMRRLILQYVPRARILQLDAPPVVGAVVMGMTAAGFDGYAVRDRMIQTARELMK